MENFIRLENLIGKEKLLKLNTKRVLIFGIGGVGGYVCEGLARCGIGEFTLVDYDKVEASNINRQIIASTMTIGKQKAEVMKDRIIAINPKAKVSVLNICINEENINLFDFSLYDYVIDAIDMVKSKIAIIEKAKSQNVNIISCMGTANKLDFTKLKIEDISKTTMCPLAKVIRKILRDKKITNVPVLYSTEQPINSYDAKCPLSSIIFVPAVAGLYIASYVVYKLGEISGRI